MKVFSLGLSVFAAFVLTACGSDDPSSAPIKDEFNRYSSDAQKDHPLSSANDMLGTSSMAEQPASSSSSVAVGPCEFSQTDSEWKFTMKGNDVDDGTSANIEIIYTINGLVVSREENIKASGSMTTSLACRLMGSDHQITEKDDGSTEDQYCEGGYLIRNIKSTEEYADQGEIQKLFNFVSQTCQIANGLADEVVPEAIMKTGCTFKEEDSTWIYAYGDDQHYFVETIIFSENYVNFSNDEVTAMSYASCRKAHPLETANRICTEYGYVNHASSGSPFDDNNRSIFFKSTIKQCQEDNNITDTAI